MAREERLYRIASYLKAGRGLAPQALLREFSASPATIKRDIAHLRDQMNLPVIFDRENWCYRLDSVAAADSPTAEAAANPERDLSADEIHALLTMQQLVGKLASDGPLAPHIGSLRMRLMQWLGKGTHRAAEVTRRIHVRPTVTAVSPPYFQAVADALLKRRRLRIAPQGQGEVREVSPQRLIHEQDRWQLDVWCHSQGAVQRFEVEAIVHADVLDAAALEVSEEQIDAALGARGGGKAA